MKKINETNLPTSTPSFNDIEELVSFKGNADDFYRKWKLISTIAKTDEQLQTIAQANSFIDSYLAWYNINIQKVDEKYYTFLNELWMFWWAYNPSFHRILLRENFIRLPFVIHETLHYLSTTQTFQDKQVWRVYKSWFESSYKDEDEWHRIFTYLNEWVTEKITREICSANNIEIWKPISNETEDKVWVKMIQDIESEAREIKSSFGELSDEELFENEEFKAKFKKILLKALDKAFEDENIKLATAYDTNVKIVKIIVNCLAIARHLKDNTKSSTEHGNEIRQSILENYFHGWVMWMREIEKVFWENYLRNLALTPWIWEIGNNSPKYQWSEAILKMTTKQVLDSLLKVVDKKMPTIPDSINTQFKIEEEKLRAMEIPVETIDITELANNLDIPYLEQLWTDDWNLSPRMLIENFDKETHHAGVVQKADLQYPIEIYFFKWQWIIIDGVHRFTKAMMQWDTTIKVRRISDEVVNQVKKGEADYRRWKGEIVSE